MRVVALGAGLLLVGIMQLRQLLPLPFRLFMTRETQLSIHGVEKALMGPGVGCMAGKATVLTVDGIVFDPHIGARVLMAGKTQLVARLQEEGGMLGGVWVVTVHAGAVLERFVLDGAAHQVFGVMAVDTELGIFRRGFEGVAVGWSVVACLAVGPDHGIVGARLEKGGLLRTMGVVADVTGALFDWIFAMCLFEGAIVALVAGYAECRWRHGEEIALWRSMGKVAFRAPLILQNLVRHLTGVRSSTSTIPPRSSTSSLRSAGEARLPGSTTISCPANGSPGAIRFDRIRTSLAAELL